MVGLDQRAESFGEAPGAIRADGHGLRTRFEMRVEPALAVVKAGDDGGDAAGGRWPDSGLTLSSLGDAARPKVRCRALGSHGGGGQ